MTIPGTHRPARQLRVVLSSTALLSFMSVWKAAALGIAELGAGAWFVPGIAGAALGGAMPWFVLAAALLGVFIRAVDVESWSMFLPAGLVGRTEAAFGRAAGRVAAATVVAERLLLAALACMIVAHYAGGIISPEVAAHTLSRSMTAEDLLTVVAVVLIGLLWIRARMGLELPSTSIAQAVWGGVGVLILLAILGLIAVARHGPVEPHLLRPPFPALPTPDRPLSLVLSLLTGLALALPVVGGGEALARAAHEFAPPRIQALRRTSLLVVLFSLMGTTLLAFAFILLVPQADVHNWMDVPLAGIAAHLAAPDWIRHLFSILLAAAALLMLVPAAREALQDAEQTLRRLSVWHALPETLSIPHPKLGTLARAIDVTAAAAIVVLIASNGRVAWLARAYTIALAATLVIKIAAVVRLRTMREGTRPFSAPFNLRMGVREYPLGLLAVAILLASGGLALLLAADLPAIAAAGLVLGLIALFTVSARNIAASPAPEPDALELLSSSDLLLRQVDARPGNVLVCVRHPHSLAHVSAALQGSGDRDVVVMTVRLLGADVDDDESAETTATPAEQQLFSHVVALTERHRRSVRLLIVPAHDVFDAIASTVVRLRSSEVFVGESASLSADDQGRLLGEAWERLERAEELQVRLVIYHHSGRTAAYHIGAHPPSLTATDLDLIHRLWRDASKAIGPHVHHHDIVRAALIQMQQQLSGPQRDEALAAIRQVTRPADELAAVVRNRDFSRLRDMVRNRDAADVATVLTELGVEDQVVVFRVLPRKDAADVFAYLSLDAQETLLRAMAQEDVASLFNNMAPDDRTNFLEELPAAATRQLLSLLTPAERSVALTLLGYPEDSIGRLMTPNYVAVREHWTVREVLDYIRSHGQDSETLNVVYVIDEQGALIDDMRIREFLLTSLDYTVAQLMDRHFVALKATDDQETAVAAFRKHDRVALPVTDTGGMLIGIVTIDDVLDVVEATATEDIQRIGGSEALDEPYMQIAFWRMIQKRAGWLTALFLGEMLTATAMGAFEAEISRAVVLTLFVPLIISSGGNSGSQASTLVIRAMALGEVGLRDWWRVMRREIFAGLALGMILATIGFLRISVWSAFSTIYTEHWLLVAITVAVALVGIVLWGTLIGSLLPMVLRRLGFDPATSSAPFVATLVDVTGLIIYFTVAMVFLRGTLL
jgi:magnesium transporter